ncbi:DUF3500 domain-containing protein [Flavobacterium restrictum]|uniref:DUF3500 domain-containing protein n=1 Tax=Flavobacterium restrictum TaxID=2594428 RepID=A0A553DRK5_9FLAO|nr:DUF3500 domain-containing protein [Flavobacterium restrictum]TRX35402.1 DUF3500 domain-containing protein [Flavobacterium restrictum]
MNTITQKDIKLPENKALVNLFAIISLAIVGTILAKTTDFSTLNLNPFNKTPQNASALFGNKKASSVASVSDVATAALAFKATLTTTQQATLEQTYTTTLARKWSNLPCGSSCRNGVRFADLTSAQLTSALAVVQAALGTGTNNGYDEFESIRIAEDYLNANGGGSGYTSGLRWMCFLGTPSATGTWMLQFGGHHYAANIAFKNGHVIGATPLFVALEPATFTYNSVYYAPMEDERTAFRNMLASLSSTQFATAKLTTTFSDCLMSPGESNGNTNTMPTTKQGLICSGLSTTQQNLVIAAMQTYVQDLDATTAASLMALYTSELSTTYVAFTGSATVGSASTFLASNSNYVRIDGPHVWIEFACQTGVVFPSQIHYHSVWRDHVSDYGVDLAGSSIDNLSVNDVSLVSKIKIYPNPTTDVLSISNESSFTNANFSITDITGRTILKKSAVSGTSANINVASLSKGTYIVKIEDEGKSMTSKFIKK